MKLSLNVSNAAISMCCLGCLPLREFTITSDMYDVLSFMPFLLCIFTMLHWNLLRTSLSTKCTSFNRNRCIHSLIMPEQIKKTSIRIELTFERLYKISPCLTDFFSLLNVRFETIETHGHSRFGNFIGLLNVTCDKYTFVYLIYLTCAEQSSYGNPSQL